ncbi:Cyclic di-GMP phosphodiesterase response regulator RpfG [Rubripirellula lacrimiformis]|uniref:diguanylate cyclase n=1 Tax=Rubripirellula lacrimiformis TaxID=1930273 RepID=A0A517NBC8_9BACT|nr:diguanylate cyclase [Rubripirellula lacrimiformis]QDT04436.1 Cyclic di-GMP phosphodiesterase response regulator RpfG [Rubripirellula lacrimiformis]
MKISSVARINFSVVSLCVAAIVFSASIGLIPDERLLTSINRAKLCGSVATNISYLINRHDVRQAGQQMQSFAGQNDDLISIGLRRTNGDYAAQIGNHQDLWTTAIRQKSDGCYTVPIQTEMGQWGKLEIQFQPVYVGKDRILSGSLWSLLGVVVVLVGTACWLQLRRILKYLDPGKSVPSRVRQALDNFAEGVVIVDKEDCIVLVNQKFARDVGREQSALMGTRLWDIPWQSSEISPSEGHEGSIGTARGTRMQLLDDHGQVLTIFSVNSSPVLDDAGAYQGVMMAFTDVTPLERNRAALLDTLEDLSQSKKAITEQNEKLTYLATRDPLTSCINRRTFFEQFENHWQTTIASGTPLCAMMVDIDFFKSINDTYGHSMGDKVLSETGRLLLETTSETDVVCRYGGEEFAILMPGLNLDAAEAVAEKIRVGLSEMQFPEFTITASLGVSGASLGGTDPQDMLDQADKCLYVAKRNGRNQVIRFDTVPADLIVDESKISREKPAEASCAGPTIPYAAVTALLSALSYRDHQTGSHSMRVSSYAALLAQRILSPKDVYVVEMGALLHDIGKVGVPDSILLKPGPLTEEEWKLMERHDRIGVEILNKSFKCPQLTGIVKYHHYRYGGIKCKAQEVWGTDIPVGARILTISDAFDAMVSNRPYRKGMPQADAIQELRRHAGTQFDPDLVEMFVQIIESGIHEPVASYSPNYADEVMLNIGEQVERLVNAADSGDGKTFVTLAERLRQTAEHSQVPELAAAATHAIEVTSEDATLELLVSEAFELLNACRAMRNSFTGETIVPPEISEPSLAAIPAPVSAQ